MNSDGTGDPRILTSIYCDEGQGPRIGNPRFSPDGSEIYWFYSTDQGGQIEKRSIAVSNPPKTDQYEQWTQVTNTGYMAFDVSNTEGVIAAILQPLPSSGRNTIVLMGLDGSDVREIYAAPAKVSKDLPDISWEPPSLTPLNKDVAFADLETPTDSYTQLKTTSHIYLVSARGGKPKMIITNGDQPCFGEETTR